MSYRKIGYQVTSCTNDLTVEVGISDSIKIPESAVNKALMITMNYLLENMETDKQEEPE